MSTKKTTTAAENVSHAKPKTTAKKPSAAEKAKAAVEKMRQASSAIPAPSAPPSELAMVPVAMIEARKQVRQEFDEDSLRELAEDIAARGMLQPILLRPIAGASNYLVIAGERRLRAARLAQLDAVPAIIGEVDDETASMMQIAENIQREDLSMADEAEAVRKMCDALGGVTATAERLHKSKAWVSKRLAASHPDLFWAARKLIENGITEDLEIVLTVDKIDKLDHHEGLKIAKLVEEGKAGRQTVREKLEAVKAEAERRAALHDEWKAEFNSPEKIEERQQQEEKRKQLERERREKERLDPEKLRHWDIDELDEDQRAIMIPHLKGIHRAGASASDKDFRRTVLDSQLRQDMTAYTTSELAAYLAGYTGAPFDLDEIQKEIEDAEAGETKEATAAD